MSMTLKPYPEYKASGISWLGEIPAHWAIRRIKHISRINPSRAEALPSLQTNDNVTFLPMEKVGTDGRIDSSDQRSIASVWNGFTYFRRNDVLIAKITPCFENGKGACLELLPTDIGFGSTEFIVLRPGQEVLPQFLYRITTLPEFRSLGADAMTGAAGQQRVPTSFVNNFEIVLPSIKEQQCIVNLINFIDYHVNLFIRTKRRLIALLNEQKQAIIHQAVTQGLDPDVRLKPSGVSWLGDIPEHWDVIRSRRLFSVRKELAGSEDVQLSSTQAYGVIPQSKYEEYVGRKVTKITMHLEKRRHVEKDDFIISMRSFQGGLERAWASGAIRSSYIVLKSQTNVDISYFEYLFKTKRYIQALQATGNFIRDGQDLTYTNFRMVDLPFLPLHEQRAIATFIARTTAAIEAKRVRLENEISLIREYRTRLIADVMTGKLDVRSVRLPTIEMTEGQNQTLLEDMIEESEKLEPVEEGAYADN